MRYTLGALAALLPLTAAPRLSVTVIDERSGQPVTTLQTSNFKVSVDGGEQRVESATYSTGPVDVMLLLDSSSLGEAVKPIAAELVAQLADGDQMAVVAFHSGADLLQDFTSGKELLTRALGRVKYGNSPRMLDALYAALDGGFQGTTRRRVMLLLTAGVDAPGRVSEREVLQLARGNAVSIYPVYAIGYRRSLLNSLARETGGAPFNLRELSKERDAAGKAVFAVLRGRYELELAPDAHVDGGLKVEVKGVRRKLFVSAVALD